MSAQASLRNIHRSPFTRHDCWWISLLLALLLHLFGFVVPYLLVMLNLILNSLFGFTLFAEPADSLKEKLKQKEMQFIIVEEAPQEEVKEADQVAAVAQKAKDMIKEQLEKEDAPSSEADSRYAPTLLGEKKDSESKKNIEMMNEPRPKPEPIKKIEEQEINREEDKLARALEMNRKKEEPEVEPEEEKQNFELNEESFEKMPETKSDDKIAVIDPEFKKKKIEKKEPKLAEERPKVEFKEIGSRKSVKGDEAKKSKESSSRIEGMLAYDTLSMKYPEYIKNVFAAIKRSMQVIAPISTRSFKAGEVAVAFGIADDGTLSFCRAVRFREEMISEKLIVEKSIKTAFATPFEPFTEEMKKDRELFQRLGVRIYFGTD